jgi:hypothetical protein
VKYSYSLANTAKNCGLIKISLLTKHKRNFFWLIFKNTLLCETNKIFRGYVGPYTEIKSNVATRWSLIDIVTDEHKKQDSKFY